MIAKEMHRAMVDAPSSKLEKGKRSERCDWQGKGQEKGKV
jgi:hypothetical protein